MTETRRQLTRAADPVLVALVVAETAIVWLIASLLLTAEPGKGQTIPPLAILGVMIVAALLPRALDAFDLWDPGFTLVMGAGIVGSTLLLIKAAAFPDVGWIDSTWLRETARALALRPTQADLPIWGLLTVSVYAWARGRRRAEPTLDAAYTGLRLGSVAMLLAAVADGVTPSPVTDGGVAGAVLAFVAASLAAVSLARMAGDQDNRLRSLRSPVTLGATLAPIALVALAGLLIGALADRDLLDTILWALAPLFWTLAVLLRVFVLIVAVIAFIIVSPILWLLSGTDFAPIRSTPRASDGDLQERLREEVERSTDVPDPIRYLIVAAILLMIVAVLGRFALRRRARLGPGPDEERSSVFDGAELLAALGNRLRQALGLLRSGADPLADLRGDRRWAHTVTVRETYAALLRRGAEQGVVRAPGRTTGEHARQLTTNLRQHTGAESEVARLTTLYDAARYGSDPATSADAAAAQQAWNAIERTMRDG